MEDNHAFDALVRKEIYEMCFQKGRPPLVEELTVTAKSTRKEIEASLARLAAGRVVVLQRESTEILMAGPFSAVPTSFQVETKAFASYANCIWDALGIPAMLSSSARIRTSCGDCGTSLEIMVSEGKLSGDSGVLHFAVPARHWWDDIVFT